MPTTRDLDVMVVCEINVDIIVSGLNGPPILGTERLVDAVTLTAGSSGVLTATGLAALGLRVGVCGLVGDDAFGQYMLRHLDEHGIDRTGVVVDAGVSTGVGILLSTRQDRAILTFAGAMARFDCARLRFDAIARARHLHLSSYFLQDALRPDVPALLARARSMGLTTSVDTGHDPADEWAVDAVLEGVDVFLPNAVEALALTGATTLAEALDHLAARVPVAVIKCGADGARAARQGEHVFVPGFAVRAVDPTGAGDAFDAGFLAGWLGQETLQACVRRGNACGALTAAHLGGTGGFDHAAVAALLST